MSWTIIYYAEDGDCLSPDFRAPVRWTRYEDAVDEAQRVLAKVPAGAFARVFGPGFPRGVEVAGF